MTKRRLSKDLLQPATFYLDSENPEKLLSVYCKQNKLQEAKTALKKATTSKELLRSIYYELSKVYSSSGEKTKAEHYLLQFKEIEEKQSPKSINLAGTYYVLGELYTQGLKYRDVS